MKKIIAFLKLIRITNLVVIALTMGLIRYCVIKPFMSFSDLSLQLSRKDFVLLVLATLFIAAAGYIINDYYDLKSDKVNRPEKVIIGNVFSLNWAIYFNFILNAAGIAFGLWLAMDIGDWNYSFIFIFTSGLLWFYSSSYKAIPLLGNFIISTLIAMVPLLVITFEMILFSQNFKTELAAGDINYLPVIYFVLGFGIFAFWMNFIREIVKDIEDIPGDKVAEKKTFPVATGEKPAKILALVMSLIMIAGFGFVYWVYLKNLMTLAYFGLFLTVPLIFLGYKLWTSTEKKDFHLVQTGLKVLMLTGLLYTMVICVQINS
ncbi:MAG: geranylgeranylglycerol-phosphate geranylgeranyltransferase [Bacteroidales bacterium]|nr:geranylgeranylglycerol-phosphate geranylgeranyltransferase [Bacteroidales bacterium]